MVKKKYIVTFLLMLIACAALFLAACGNTEKQESGAEVGTYYNDDSGNEYLISLKEQGLSLIHISPRSVRSRSPACGKREEYRRACCPHRI